MATRFFVTNDLKWRSKNKINGTEHDDKMIFLQRSVHCCKGVEFHTSLFLCLKYTIAVLHVTFCSVNIISKHNITLKCCIHDSYYASVCKQANKISFTQDTGTNYAMVHVSKAYMSRQK